MTGSASAELKEFFTEIWHDTEGYVYLPVKENGRVRKFFLQWPAKADTVVRHVIKWAAMDGCEIYFSPALYSKMQATNKAVLGSHVAWADFDGNFPDKWPTDVAPVPHIEVQSSVSTKRHVYWKLDELTPPKEVEKINRALAYALEADTSGWDANQFLRPPYSVNRKYQKPIVAKIVANRTELSPVSQDAFSNLPTPAEAIREEISMADVPGIEDVKALAKWDEDLLNLFSTTGEEARATGFDRSGALARIAYKGAELSWTDEQIYAALLDADGRWGKYAGRLQQQKILVELINRARAKVGYDFEATDNALLKALLHDDTVKVESGEADSDFLSVSQLNAIPGIEDWRITGLLTPGGIGLFTGHAGTGKTQLAFQLAADLATGREQFVETFDLEQTPRKVLFLSLEMGKYQLGHFTEPLSRRYPSPKLDENLVVYAKGEPLPLDQEAGQTYFLQMIDEHKPDVVIADSLSHMSSTDVKDDQAMKALFEFLGKCRSRFEFGMIIVHHHRKKANDAASKKQANSQDDIYGSFYISAAIDFALDLEDRSHDGILDLNLLKARFRPKFEQAMKISRDQNLHFTVAEINTENFDFNLPDPTGNGGPNLAI